MKNDWLNNRRDFLHVYQVPSVSGQGWDVVMRVDGTYATYDLAEIAKDEMRDEISGMIESVGRDWWDGPTYGSVRAGIIWALRAAMVDLAAYDAADSQ